MDARQSAPDNTSTPIMFGVEYLHSVSYAHVRNSIPFVSSVIVFNRAFERNATSLRATMSCDDEILCETVSPIGASRAGRRLTAHHFAKFLPPPARLAQIKDEESAELHFELFDEEGFSLAKRSYPVRLLGQNRWNAKPCYLALELLATHVRPSASSIVALASTVREAMRSNDTEQRFLTIEEAIAPDVLAQVACHAFTEWKLHLRPLPKNWIKEGAAIIDPDSLRESGVGTELDIALALASVFEALGLAPLLWISGERVLVGYWRTRKAYERTISQFLQEFRNRLHLEELEVLDVTECINGAPDTAFERAVQEGRNVANMEALVDGAFKGAIIDVSHARLSHIFPIDVEDTSDVLPATVAPTQPFVPEKRQQPVSVPSSVPQQVRRWKAELLDLSLRNHLLNFSERTAATLSVPDGDLSCIVSALEQVPSLDLMSAEELDEVSVARSQAGVFSFSSEVLKSALFEHNQLHTHLDSGPHTSRLTHLRRHARLVREETGANNLFLALGFLQWQFEERDLLSPLILVPINLERRSGGPFSLRFDETNTAVPNYCLLEKLRLEFGMEIPDFFETEEGIGIDIAEALNAIRSALAEAHVPGTVKSDAAIAILQFSTHQMWRDLDSHWETFTQNPLVEQLIRNPDGVYVDEVLPISEPKLDEMAAMLPMPADASQIAAIRAAIAGQTFVLEGPPGTGKSQTIANLLAYSMLEGKRVLFVAEKRAALEAVSKRLDSVGLGKFTLELHDKNATPATVRTQLREALETDGTSSVRAHERSMREQRWLIEQLDAYSDSIHCVNGVGYSLYDAVVGVAQAGGDKPSFEIPVNLVRKLDSESLAELREVVEDYAHCALEVKAYQGREWNFVKMSGSCPVPARELFDAALRLKGISEKAAAFGIDIDFIDIAARANRLPQWSAAIEAKSSFSAETLEFYTVSERLEVARKLIRELREIESSEELRVGRTVFRPESLPAIPFVAAEATAILAIPSRLKRFRESKRFVRRIGPYLVQPDVNQNPDMVLRAAERLNSIRGRVQEAARVGREWGLLDVDDGWWPTTEVDASEANRLALVVEAVDACVEVSHDELFLQICALAEPATILDLVTRFTEDATLFARFSGFSDINDQHLGTCADGQAFFPAWIEKFTRCDMYESWKALKARVRYLEAEARLRAYGLDDVADSIADGRISIHRIVLELDSALLQACVKERSEAAHTSAFDATIHEEMIDALAKAVQTSRTATPAAISTLLEERRDATFAADVRGRKILERELQRRRGGLRVRGMFREMRDLILATTPCVLMSPSSVARFLEPGAVEFDIVVFDEASQIRVASAIGALGRARCAVIVGDSRQMPPTSVAEVSLYREDNGRDMSDEESILARCIAAGVDSHRLTWHYRSENEELIAFSNERYYDGDLSTFPSPSAHGDAIRFVRVDGTFQRSTSGQLFRTNVEEAEAIVDEVRRRFAENEEVTPSIGIVTFNIHQRELIETLLMGTADERINEALENPDGLFVKNLENVQGDERDVILFSVAFSKDDNGALPLNFGPLTRTGGERRLNVAITRARCEVVVFASFDPEDLRLEDTTSEGLRDLHDYLVLARDGVGTNRTFASQSSDDMYREEIAQELRHAGLHVQTAYGLSGFKVDIAVAGTADAKASVAVLLDGADWRRRASTIDRYILPNQMLTERMGWKRVERIWLPQWLTNREGTVRRIVEAVQAVEGEETDMTIST